MKIFLNRKKSYADNWDHKVLLLSNDPSDFCFEEIEASEGREKCEKYMWFDVMFDIREYGFESSPSPHSIILSSSPSCIYLSLN